MITLKNNEKGSHYSNSYISRKNSLIEKKGVESELSVLKQNSVFGSPTRNATPL